MAIRADNRYQAFGIHLIISGLIFISLTSVIIFFWYPGFLFSTDGGWQGIRMIAGIDLVLGPLLTLLLYKKDKPGLKFDLTCIGTVQLACLVAGMYIVYQERPMAMVFANDTFHSMSKTTFASNNIDYHKIDGINPFKPTWIYVSLPADEKERRQVLAKQLTEGPLYAQTDRYRPFHDHIATVLAEGKHLEQLPKLDAKTPGHQDVKYFNLITRYGETYLGLDVNSGKPTATLDKPAPQSDEKADQVESKNRTS